MFALHELGDAFVDIQVARTAEASPIHGDMTQAALRQVKSSLRSQQSSKILVGFQWFSPDGHSDLHKMSHFKRVLAHLRGNLKSDARVLDSNVLSSANNVAVLRSVASFAACSS